MQPRFFRGESITVGLEDERTPTPAPRISNRKTSISFDWKLYAHTMLWMLSALALFNFCAIIVHLKVEGVWKASGVETGNRAIHLMKDSGRSGWLCAKIALACCGTLMGLAEVLLKGHPKIRRSGCHVLAFSTNFAALTVYRRAAALCGIFPATENLAVFGSTRLSLGAEMLDPTEAGGLDTLERYDLLDAAIVLVEKSQNPVIRHQLLGQALIIRCSPTKQMMTGK